MLKENLDKCFKEGNLNEAEYNEWLSGMSENDRGELVGICPNGKTYYKYEMNGDIFDIPLWEFVKKKITPPLGVETMFDVFAKYGHTYGGICDGFYWNEEALRSAPEIDLWKMIAISERCWETQYERWYYREQKKKEPARDFTIKKIVDYQPKYIILEDTDGRLHGINYNGFDVQIVEK